MSKKLNYDFVANHFKSAGCDLLETSYVNNHTPMQYRCKCGNVSKISFSHFKQGKRCKKCAGHDPYTLVEVAYHFKSAGCDLLETSYVNNHTPMQYRCKCGNISKISFSHFKQGKRCRSCGVKKLSVAQKFSFDYVNNYFINNGCVLLSKDYINQTAKLSYICICGTKSTISFKNFKRGVRCRECYLANNKGSGNPRWKQDREKLKFDKSLKSRFRRCLRATLTAIKENKKRSTKCLLGYTPGELENHILSHPNWVRCKNTTWHLDHIFPIEAFVQRNIHDVKLINCLDNLQPLPAKENLTKYTTYDSTEFNLWLKSKGML